MYNKIAMMPELKKGLTFTVPNVVVEDSIEKETDVFISFLHHKKFPQNRERIFRVFPELKSVLEGVDNKDEERRIVRDFVANYYSVRPAIKKIISHNKEKIRSSGETVLREIARLMDFVWSDTHDGYVLVPTILPFSPFKDNIIYFSILRNIRKNKSDDDVNHEILPLLAHEISHLILMDIMRSAEQKECFARYGWTTKHFLQEILAPILMNQEPLKTLLGIRDYFGNPYLKKLNVKDHTDIRNIVIYFMNLYEKMRTTKNRPFVEIVKIMAQKLQDVQPQLEAKLNLWNKHGSSLISDSILLEKYEEPVVIK